jgi:hypothetical protein
LFDCLLPLCLGQAPSHSLQSGTDLDLFVRVLEEELNFVVIQGSEDSVFLLLLLLVLEVLLGLLLRELLLLDVLTTWALAKPAHHFVTIHVSFERVIKGVNARSIINLVRLRLGLNTTHEASLHLLLLNCLYECGFVHVDAMFHL